MNKLNTHLTRNGVLTGQSSPVGVISPQFIGQHYIQDDGEVYVSYGLNSNAWNKLQSGDSLNISVPTYEDMLKLPTKAGSICFVEESETFYKFIDNEWKIDRNYVVQTEEPQDKNVIWFSPVGTVAKPSTHSDVTVEELVASVSVLVTKIRGLEKRIAYIEDNGFQPPSNEDEKGVLLMENGEKLLLEDGSSIQLENIQ